MAGVWLGEGRVPGSGQGRKWGRMGGNESYQERRLIERRGWEGLPGTESLQDNDQQDAI